MLRLRNLALDEQNRGEAPAPLSQAEAGPSFLWVWPCSAQEGLGHIKVTASYQSQVIPKQVSRYLSYLKLGNMREKNSNLMDEPDPKF